MNVCMHSHSIASHLCVVRVPISVSGGAAATVNPTDQLLQSTCSAWRRLHLSTAGGLLKVHTHKLQEGGVKLMWI